MKRGGTEYGWWIKRYVLEWIYEPWANKTDRNKTIRNLALSTIKEMINLGFTNEEYEYFKWCMDKKVKMSKITLWNLH